MKELHEFVRPSVTVDTVVLTVMYGETPELYVVIDRIESGQLALPGTFLHEHETLQEAAIRALREKAGVRGVLPEQLHVFDALDRDPRGWIISVAHIAVVDIDQLDDVGMLPVTQATNLAYDHDAMLALALEKLRADYAEAPDPWQLLDTFTLRELREVHEAIDPDTPLRDSFRRQMQPMLVDTGQLSSGSVGKPSRVWRRETEQERILRKYGKQERPVSKPQYATSSAKRSHLEPELDAMLRDAKLSNDGWRGTGDALYSLISASSSSSPKSDRDYALEIDWPDGRVTRDENLSPTQAGLRLRELADEMRSAWSSLTPDARPLRARIVTPWGDTEQSIDFSADHKQ